MSLRNRVPDGAAQYPDPVLGINLRSSIEDLKPGEALQMQNCIYLGGTRMRTGSNNINSSAFDANNRIRGIHKYYYGGASPSKKRLIAYDTNISSVTDGGVETVINSGLTSDKEVQFLTWPITDKVYITNSSDVLRSYDGNTDTWATVSGTNVPTPRWIAPIGDRLMAITSAGIERTNARSDSVWSSDSSWATLRPSRPGLFTALQPISVKGLDSIYSGLLAFQPNSTYLVTGTNFGSDVTAASASTGEDSKIQLIDPYIGTSSPKSVVAIPGVGTAWFTNDLNVYLLPEGSLKGMYIGDKLKSSGAITGIESTNSSALSAVWMAYFDRFLMLAVPTGSSTYPTVQYWMDMYSLQLYPKRGPVWYGPMTGQTIGQVVVENQQSDFAMYGGEGNDSTGAFVYTMRVGGLYTDAVGTTDNNISMVYQTHYSSFGSPTLLKYVRSVHFDLSYTTGTPTVSLYDIDGTSLTSQAIDTVTN